MAPLRLLSYNIRYGGTGREEAIADVITTHGLVNVDFADVRTIMSGAGEALMGIGTGTGPDRAVNAARQAVQSPLLENVSIEGAKGVQLAELGLASWAKRTWVDVPKL